MCRMVTLERGERVICGSWLLLLTHTVGSFPMWEYTQMWHRAQWTGPRTADGWGRWVMSPKDVAAPPVDATDMEALNFMGRSGWEVIHVKNVIDLPPDVTNASYGSQRRQYLLKRRVQN